MDFISNFKGILRLLYPFRVVALGLAVSQVIATVLVYLSNRALAEKIAAIQAAGYGPLPGVNIDPPLSSLEAAFAGGAFFTLSTGAGVVLLTFGAVMLVSALPPIYRLFILAVLKPGRRALSLAVLLPVAAAASVLVIGWPVLLILTNAREFCPGLTAFLVLVPPVVIWASLKWSPRKTGHSRLPWRNPFHFVLIAILLALWASQVNEDVFVNFKDNMLLTSRTGTQVVDFYYRYTLYPAEVFKRLTDKQLKTCVLEGAADAAETDRLESVLRAQNFFVIPAGSGEADLKLVCREFLLVLMHEDEIVLTVDRRQFMISAEEILGQFSEKTDNNAVFRHFTIIALVGVAPLVLYLTTYAFFCLLPGILTGIRVASFLVPLLCFGFWAGAMMVLDTPPVTGINQSQAAAAIREGDRKDRLAALRYIHEHKLDIADFPGYRDLFATTDFAQRYWLISNLGRSREPGTAPVIMRFLESDSAYIVCKTMAAAAERSKKQGDIDRQQFRQGLVERMESSNNWYVQFYAYKAARRLGWVPEKSG